LVVESLINPVSVNWVAAGIEVVVVVAATVVVVVATEVVVVDDGPVSSFLQAVIPVTSRRVTVRRRICFIKCPSGYEQVETQSAGHNTITGVGFE
jgi:hypothetical protein